jgi:biotin synthase-related radical SAM superfamily protein
MATRAQILKLGERIEALANLQAASVHGKVPIIIVDGCSEADAAERHYQAHPGDRGAARQIFLHVVDPPAR